MSIGSDAKLFKAAFSATSIRKLLFAGAALAVMGLSGCHVIGLPSYRYDAATTGQASSMNCENGYCTQDSVTEDCQGGILPPMPGWLAEWRMRRQQKEDLPEAPEFPRFHPLPTRPVFEARPGDDNIPQILPGSLDAGSHQAAMPLDSSSFAEGEFADPGVIEGDLTEYFDEFGNRIASPKSGTEYGRLSGQIRR